MEVILSKYCETFSGMLSKRHGYYIRRVGNRFFGQRKSQGEIAPNGHWDFIVSCAEIACSEMLLANIRVSGEELIEAATEAGYPTEGIATDAEYGAAEVLRINADIA